jgi:lysophospholipase L1-like esterase
MRYGNVELHNVCAITEDKGKPGFGISRLPLEILGDINAGARNMVRMGAGCEIRGLLAQGGQAKVVLQVMDSNTTPPLVTVYHGCFCSQSIVIGSEPTEIIVKYPATMAAMSQISAERKLPFDPGLLRIRLPPIHTASIISIDGDLSYPVHEALPSRTLLCYGSSITHGACAIPPEGTYASQCARRLGCDLINLGCGGSAQMDRAIADHIASRRDWDVATLEMGINVRTWPLEKFYPVAENFVSTIAAAHPEKYIFCIDMFTNDCDFEAAPSKGVGFREALKEIAGKFNTGKVIHVDGRDILTDPTGLRTDLVHPCDDAMHEMGMNLAAVISRAWKK